MCAVRDASAEVARPAGGPGARAADAAVDSALYESGRGLGIIDALSAAWGISTDGFGKWLWFCLDSTIGVEHQG